MLIDRRWRLVLLPLAVAAYAVPALAQQPAPNGAAPAAGAAVKKPPKPKPAPATTGTADAVAAAAGGAKPTLLGQYGDWGAYTASPGGKKICFAIAKPASSETTPAGKTRNPSYMFISSRPGEKVTDEVSIIIGYPFKPNSEATVAVGTASFALYTQQDGAWIKNAAEEAHLIEAMRSGKNVVIKGMSAKGTRSTDVFSLKGLAQALDRTDQDCK
jgi:Invasion associated locus B (IalB) protein